MNHLKLIYFLLITCLFAAACTSTQKVMQASDTIAVPDKVPNMIPVSSPIVESGLSPERMQRFEDFLAKEAAEGKIPGAVCLVKKNGVVAYDKVFGMKEMGGTTPMTKDEIFYIQSMTKPIVSIAFMMLYEEGHFVLTDPIKKYLPQFEKMQVATSQKKEDMKMIPAESDITIRQVLSHTAGMSHGLTGTDYDNQLAMSLYFSNLETIEERVNTLAKYPLMGQPGKQWHYSASPDVLALLIEKFSGMTCAQFLQERIFDPLGMSNTGYNMKAGTDSKKAMLYTTNKEGKLDIGKRQTPKDGHTVYGGTHGLFSTAGDYMKFAEMLLNNGKANGKVLIGRKTLELMTTDILGDISQNPGNGFGLGFGVLTDVAKSASLGSEGTYYWSGAFNTYFFVDPEEDMAVVMMMQFEPYTNFYASKLRQFVYQAIID